MKNKAIIRLDISDSIISKQNMIHLWLALHKNISVCELIYSRCNFFAIQEMGAIDLELKLNNVIQDKVIPVLKKNGQSSEHICLKGLQMD